MAGSTVEVMAASSDRFGDAATVGQREHPKAHFAAGKLECDLAVDWAGRTVALSVLMMAA